MSYMNRVKRIAEKIHKEHAYGENIILPGQPSSPCAPSKTAPTPSSG